MIPKRPSEISPHLMLNHAPEDYIHETDRLEPEFYSIADFRNAQKTATPRWLSIWIVQGVYYAHPSVIEGIKHATELYFQQREKDLLQGEGNSTPAGLHKA